MRQYQIKELESIAKEMRRKIFIAICHAGGAGAGGGEEKLGGDSDLGQGGGREDGGGNQ